MHFTCIFVSIAALTSAMTDIHDTVPRTADDLKIHTILLRKNINLPLLLPYLIRQKALTPNEEHELQKDSVDPMERIGVLITRVLPSKGNNGLEYLLKGLKDSLNEPGSAGHKHILEKVFKIPLVKVTEKLCMYNEDLITLLTEYVSIITSSVDNRAIKTALEHTIFYLCQLKLKENDAFLLSTDTRFKLRTESNLTFMKLFDCLSNDDSPVIIPNDVSLLHRINTVIGKIKEFSLVLPSLNQLVSNYEREAAIENTGPPSCVSNSGKSRLKVTITNAHSSGPQLKLSVNSAFLKALNEITFNFCGKDSGSVILYWEFQEEYYEDVHQSLEHAYQNEIQLGQLLVTKVEMKPDQSLLNLEMKIIDPMLLHVTEKRGYLVDLLASEQDKYLFLLLRIIEIGSKPMEEFLQHSFDKSPETYALLEGKTLLNAIEVLISRNRLHCYDISIIQHCIYEAYKWFSVQYNDTYGRALKILLVETQDYNPQLATPSGEPKCAESHATIITFFFNIFHVNFEVMMTL